MDETNGPLGSEGHRSSSADVLAAETIQASARGHLARRGRGASSLDASHPPAEANRTPAVAQEEHCAAEQLQALARGHLARKHAKQPRDRAASDSNATDASDPTVGVAPSPDEAAERLQALARGHLARKHHRVGVASAREGDAAAPQVEMGKSAAAETLQSLARGHLARKAARKSDHPVRNPDAAEPGPAERERRATGGDDLGSGGDVVDERGAGGGHAPAEGDSDANRRAREQEAATALQALARGHLARTHGAPGTPQIGVADAGTGHPSQDDAAIVLQALARGHLARRHGSGGHLHQRGDPSTDAAKEAASAGDDGGPERVGEGTVEADAAALLQSASKGHLARRHMGSYEGALGGAAEAGRGEEEGREESRSPLGENGAAILIQSAARGRLARKREAASMRGVKGGASGAQGRGGGHGGGRGDASEDNEVEERAATALQSLARGHLTRRRQGAGVGSRADGRGVEGGGGGGRMNEDSAASIVQSLARGHLARRRVRRVRGDSTRAGGEGVAVEHERTDQRVRDRQLEGKEREDGGERELVGEETMEHVAARDADVRDAHEPAVRVVLGMASRKVVIEMKTGGVEEVGHGNVNADEGSAAADTLVEDANGKGDAADEGTADEGGADGVPLEVASGDATKGRGNAGEVGSAEGGVVDSAADEVLRKSDSKRESKEDSIARLRALSNRRFESPSRSYMGPSAHNSQEAMEASPPQPAKRSSLRHDSVERLRARNSQRGGRGNGARGAHEGQSGGRGEGRGDGGAARAERGQRDREDGGGERAGGGRGAHAQGPGGEDAPLVARRGREDDLPGRSPGARPSRLPAPGHVPGVAYAGAGSPPGRPGRSRALDPLPEMGSPIGPASVDPDSVRSKLSQPTPRAGARLAPIDPRGAMSVDREGPRQGGRGRAGRGGDVRRAAQGVASSSHFDRALGPPIPHGSKLDDASYRAAVAKHRKLRGEMEQIKQRHVRETEDRLEQLQAWLVEEEQRRAMAAEALASERQAKLEQRLWEQRMKRERQALERQRLLEQERRNPVGRPKYKEMERRFERHAIEEQELREMAALRERQGAPVLPYGAEAEEAQPTQHARVLTGRQARRAAYDAHVHRVRAGAASARDGGRPKGQSGRPMVAHGDFGMGGHLADEYGYEMGEGPYDDVPGVPDANGSPRRAVNPTRGEELRRLQLRKQYGKVVRENFMPEVSEAKRMEIAMRIRETEERQVYSDLLREMPHPNRQHNARSARPAADAGGAHHVLGLRPTMDSDDEQLLQTSVREIQRSIVPRRERGAQAKRGPSAAPHRVAPKKTLDPNLKRRVESARVGPGGVAPVGRSAKGGQEHKGGKGARGGGVLMQALEEQMGEGGEGRRHGNGNARGEKARESFGAWDDGVGGEGKKAAGLEDWGVDLRTP